MTLLKMTKLKITLTSALVIMAVAPNAHANSTIVTDAVGTPQLWEFEELLGQQRLTRKTNQVDGKGITQTWDDNGNKLSRTDEEGRTATYTYNATNQRTSMTEASGTPEERTTTYEYVNQDIDLVTVTTSPSIFNSLSKTVTNTYDDNLNITSVTINGFDAQGNSVTRSTTFEHDEFGKVTQIDGPRVDVNDITTLEYYDCASGGQCGQLQRVTNALGHVTSYDRYDNAARLLESTDANGVQTSYVYHPRGWLLSVTQSPPTGTARVTTYEYDNVGQMTKSIQADGTEQNYVYNAAHELTEVFDNLGNRINYAYDAKGNRTDELVTDPDGTLVLSTITTYDIRNYIESINSGGSVTQLINDAVGNLGTQTDPNLNPDTSHEFDALDRLTNTVDALTNDSTYQYNVADQLTEVTAPNGSVTQYEYDDLGNQTKEVSPDRGTITYVHDEAGNVISMTDARGIAMAYDYDALNRVTDIIFPTSSENVSYRYDNGTFSIGRMHQSEDDSGSVFYEYDPWGNVTTTTSQPRDEANTAILGTFVTEYQYDPANRVIAMTYPNGRTVIITRDGIGRLIGVQSTGSNGVTTDLITNRSYRADGLWTSQTYGNGLTQTKNYDTQGRLTQQNADSYDRQYNYDDNGNILDLFAADNSFNSDYRYDVLNRLDRVEEFINGDLQEFTYDPNSNRQRFTENGVSSNLSYQADSNRLSEIDGTSLNIDASGRTLQDEQGRQFSYNDAGRIASISINGAVVGEYTYNSQQLRTHKVANGLSTLYHYDLSGNLILETSFEGTEFQDYVYADGERIATETTGIVDAINPEPSTPITNLAEGKLATQSTTAFGGVASRAVDGNTSGVWGQRSVTHTVNSSQPWWQVDLGGLSDIQNIVLHNRTNCCSSRLSDFYVFVSDAPFANASLDDLLADSSIQRTFHVGTLAGSSVSLPLQAQGQYVRVQLMGSNALSLAEVEVMGAEASTVLPPAINLSQNKLATQSTTGFGGAASRAVDGNTDGIYNNSSVTHTARSTQPWWQVDLGELSDIQNVVLHNRTKCCSARLSNFYVLVSDAPFANASLAELLADSNVSNQFHEGTLSGSSVSLSVNTQGRYVRVQLSGTNPLSLAEVEVMGSVASISTGGNEQEPETVEINAGLHYYINDHLSTPQQLVDSNNQVSWDATYEAFGAVEITTQEVINNHRFPGQYGDVESGLYYNWNRYYDSGVGRYVTSDPIGLAGGLNTYGYVGGNPLMYSDPRGESAVAGALPISGGLAVADGPLPFGDILGGLFLAGAVIYDLCTDDGEEGRCRKVKNSCIQSCSDFGLPSKYGDGVSFRRCVRNCMERQGCYNF